MQEGILSTANSFDLSEKDREWITKNDATVKDMEVGGPYVICTVDSTETDTLLESRHVNILFTLLNLLL